MGSTRQVAGLTRRELEQRFGLTRRVIHSWIEGGLIRPPTRQGPRSTYDEEQVLRVAAIRKMREQRMGLDAIKRWLSSATREQLEALVNPPPAGAPPAPAPGPAAVVGAERWDHIPLLPGLELHVRADAGPLVLRLAAEIAERYRTGG